jgi:carbonic anhydrase
MTNQTITTDLSPEAKLMTDTDDKVMQRLLAGIKGFQKRYYEQSPERMKELTEHGQHPKVLLISCSDSRVDPAILTGASPGDLFVVRNVANLVPPYKLEGNYDGARAAIEYAVRDLGVSHIVVLGHAHCGGIKALLHGARCLLQIYSEPGRQNAACNGGHGGHRGGHGNALPTSASG